jgi:hypothetical protein
MGIEKGMEEHQTSISVGIGEEHLYPLHKWAIKNSRNSNGSVFLRK